MKIGILAMQGAFLEHERMLQALGAETLQVRKAEELEAIDGLIIPGGESTTIGKLIRRFGLDEGIKTRAKAGMPVYGTCAGLILLAKGITGSDQFRLGLMDVTVTRNAYGRQVDSFEEPLVIEGVGEKAFPAVFIRAPYIEEAGADVEVLAIHRDKVVMARQKNCLGSAFHPELTGDDRIHRYFLDMVEQYRG